MTHFMLQYLIISINDGYPDYPLFITYLVIKILCLKKPRFTACEVFVEMK